jgi:hypothetical protein
MENDPCQGTEIRWVQCGCKPSPVVANIEQAALGNKEEMKGAGNLFFI